MNKAFEDYKVKARADFPHLYEDKAGRPDFRKLGDYNTDNCCWVRQTGSGAVMSCHPSTPGAFQMYYGETSWVHVGEANTEEAVKAKLVEMGWADPETHSNLMDVEQKLLKRLAHAEKMLTWIARNFGAHAANIKAVALDGLDNKRVA